MSNAATIFALSSGKGRAGVAVIRVSGPAVPNILSAMVVPIPEPRMVRLRKLRDPASGDILDEALVIFFAAPKTETGEAMAEFHVHGGSAVIRAVLDALGRNKGCRLAEPGEFARRAFANGKLDLAQAEGLADLIDAETEAQRRHSLGQLSGHQSRLYEGWREALIGALALVEAAIDFSDESDVAADAFGAAVPIVQDLRLAIVRHLDDGHRGEILRDGFRVVLAGPPNVGKSSLLNALARREAAIVSDEPGTTRDVIEVRLDLDGLPVIVSDTAGIRAAESRIEQEGIRRSREHMRAADLVLWVTEPGLDAVPAEPVAAGVEVAILLNKADLSSECAQMFAGALPPVSAMTGAGLDALTAWLSAKVANRVGGSAHLAVAQARHRQHLEASLSALDHFLAGDKDHAELRAEDVRQAVAALGRIVGRVDAEDVLGAIFGRFCIGK